jgi:hypothetical protein
MQHLHDNKIIGSKTSLLTIIIATLTLSLIILVSETQDQLFAKKSSHTFPSNPSSSGGTGSSFSSSGNSSADNGGSRRAITDLSNSPGSIDPTHCDQPGYPSCYTVGYSDGQANPGTSCPSDHSSAYCTGYNAGSRASSSSSSAGSQGNNFAPENGGTSSGTGSVYAANHHGSTVKQGSRVNLNQLGQTSTNVGVTNSTSSRPNSESNIGNNANLNSNQLGLLSSHKSKVHNLSSSIIHQNSNVNINQTGQSNSKLAVTNSSGSQVSTKSNIGNGANVNSNLLNLHSPSHKSVSHGALLVKKNTKTNINQTGQTNTGINVTNSPHSNVNSKSNVNNNAIVNTLLSSSHKFGSPLDLTQKTKTNVNQAGQINTGINVTNSPHSNVNTESNINNNANVNSNLNSNVNNPSRYIGSLPSPSSSLNQNSKTTINQGAENNADINVNNSPGTRITNEQTIKQSVRINNEVNNIIKNNEVNNIIKENTISAPQQPLTDIVTVKLAKSSMSSGALFPLADVAPYRLIGGHITANLPSSSQQNIVVAQVSDDGNIEHAVILDLNQVTGSNLDQNSLYETSLGSDISGTNPFTGNQDEVSSITNLFLWNNNQQSIVFDNANGVTMNLIYK